MKKITLFLLSLFLVVIGVNGQDNLVAHYDFNEGTGTVLTDQSGNGHDGVINGGTWADGALQIEPMDEFVELSGADDATFSLTEYTIHLKFKFNEIPGAWTQIYASGDGPDHVNGMVLVTDGDNHFNFITKINTDDVAANNWFPGTTVATKDVWYDLAITYNPIDSINTIYLNGEVEAVSAPFQPLAQGIPQITRLGIDYGGWGAEGNIVYDDLKVYNECLSLNEIYPSTSGLIAHYDFNEGADTILTDISGNGHNGAIVGGTWIDGALQIEPMAEYVELSNGDDATFSLSEYTIHLKFKFNEIPDAWTQIYASGDGPDHVNGMALVIDGDGHFNFITKINTDDVAANNWFPGTTVATKDVWYDLAVTYDPVDSINTMYLNGEVEAVSAPFQPLAEGINQITHLGIDYGGWGAEANIVYDDLKVHEKALTRDEIYPLENNLVAHYNFNEGADTILIDVTGNGHEGAIVGGTWVDGALQIEPMAEYVELSNGDDATFSLSEYTINLKFKFNEVPGAWTQIYASGDGPDHVNGMVLVIDGDGHFNFITKINTDDVAANNWFPGTTVATKDVWYDFSVTYNPLDSITTMYLNGEVEAVSAPFEPLAEGINQITRLGIDYGGWGAEGSIVYDDLKVYNIALTHRQVLEQYYGEIFELTTSIVGYGEISQVTPTTFSGLYPAGTEVTLAAVPTTGFSFLSWTGDIESIIDTITITMDQDMDLTATFSEGSVYYLDMSVVGNGSVTPESGNFAENSKVELVATPDEGYEFIAWSGDFVSENATDSIVMDANKTVVATFEKIKYQLTVTMAGTGTGTVTPENGMYSGSQFLTATADAGSVFMGWSGDTEGAGSVIAIQMDGPKNVTATFDIIDGVADHSNLKLAVSNYPNPFTGITTINYTIEETSSVTLTVYDVFGKIVEVLVSTNQNSGSYTIDWDGSALSNGIYFYQLQSNSKTITNKMLLSK